MTAVLENLKTDAHAPLQILNLATPRGWLQILALVVCAFVSLKGASDVLGAGLSMAGEGGFGFDNLLDLAVGLFLLLPAWLFVNAIRARHLTIGKILILVVLLPPVGLLFVFLRISDKKHYKQGRNHRLASFA